MNWPPVGWTPEKTIPNYYNGTATKGAHVRDIDREATYLACYKHNIPVILANYFAAGTTYEAVINIPPFTEHVAFWFHCTGRGTITVTNDDDTYNSVMEVHVGGGVTHTFADAEWVKSGEGLTVPAANGKHRALNSSFEANNHKDTYTWAITDLGGGATLRIYGVRFKPLWPGEVQALSAAT